MRLLQRAWLAWRIAYLEGQIQARRGDIAVASALLDEDRRKANLAHQALAALDGRRPQTVYQLKGR
jgi:hypothetical protein